MKSKCAGFHYEGDWGGPRYCIVHGHFLDTYLRLRLSIPEENSAEMKPRTVSEASQIFPSLLEALFYLSGDLYQNRAQKSPANEVQIVNPKKTKEKPAAVPRPAIHWLSRLWCVKRKGDRRHEPKNLKKNLTALIIKVRLSLKCYCACDNHKSHNHNSL